MPQEYYEIYIGSTQAYDSYSYTHACKAMVYRYGYSYSRQQTPGGRIHYLLYTFMVLGCGRATTGYRRELGLAMQA